jgi:hypothetical protein
MEEEKVCMRRVFFSFFDNSMRQLVLEEMQHDAETPGDAPCGGGQPQIAMHCTICWSTNNGDEICSFGLQQRLQKPQETI